jgi:asparagine synthase (glutamine-hydrolysing)
MCGIAGIINLDGKPVARNDLEAVNRNLAHRGPDGDGFFCERNVGLAHRRLAIIDPRLGVQPFYNNDRSIVLSYNGEVYNYVELRKELESEFAFTTQSDTEVVVRAYEKWGIACLDHFRGMFAFALYDANKKVVYLVRDRVGIKPLYYYHAGGCLLFASELAALLQFRDFRREIVHEALSGFFRYQYVPAPSTVYKDCYKLEPGYYLEIRLADGIIANRQYWNLRVHLTDRSEEDWLEELNALLDDTVRMYVRSDVPFGAFLSGGVDSSLVTALMARHLAEPVRTFTIGFEEEAHSELPYAAQASHKLGTNHYEKIVSPQLAEDILRTIVIHFGEPFADSSAIPTYYVSREAASQVKMVLSGDGGDELFGGYNSYQTTFHDYHGAVPGRTGAALRLLARYGLLNSVRRWACSQEIPLYQSRHDAQRQIFGDADLRDLLVPEVPVAPAVIPDIPIVSAAIDPVTYFQAHDFKTYMVDDVLTKVDRMSMANSLEVRVPLLDHKVVELAFSLPLALKLRLDDVTGQLQTKYLLKKSAERFYTTSFLARPKQGFGIPIVEWCRGPLRALIEARLRETNNPIFQWIKFSYTQRILDDFFQDNPNLVARVWFVLMFDLWMKHVHRAV